MPFQERFSDISVVQHLFPRFSKTALHCKGAKGISLVGVLRKIEGHLLPTGQSINPPSKNLTCEGLHLPLNIDAACSLSGKSRVVGSLRATRFQNYTCSQPPRKNWQCGT